MKPFVRSLGLVCALVLALPDPVVAQTMLYGKNTKLVTHFKTRLTQIQRNGVAWLGKDKQYFGAIAILPDSDIYVGFKGFHSLVTVRRFALEGCRLMARDAFRKPNGCRLYASVLPRSMDPKTQEATGLGRPAYIAFRGAYTRNQVPGKYGAFAISGMSNFGYTYGFSTEADARGSALARCEATAAQDIAGYSNNTRARIAAEKLDTCRIVHVTRPES